MAIIVTKEGRYLFIQNEKFKYNLRYDLAEKTFEKQDRYGNWVQRNNYYKYFSGYNCGHIIWSDGTERFKKIIEVIDYSESRIRNLSSYFFSLSKYAKFEEYFGLGIELDRYTYTNLKGTKELHKNLIKYLQITKSKWGGYAESRYRDYKEFWDPIIDTLMKSGLTDEQLKEFDLTRLIEYKRDTVNTLLNYFNYKLKSLVQYLCNYLRPFENCSPYEGITLLRDYYNMASQIGRKVKKYPKYLKSMHDIIQANYDAYKKEYDEQKFQEMKRPDLIFEEQIFKIKIPETTKDIIAEGTNLNHCVSSYVDKIINGTTYIVFLRLKDKEDDSLVTVEIQNDSIVQAKGSYNRALYDEERKFLEKYAEVKQLRYGV